MTKRALILTALAVLLLSGCDRDYYINDGCTLNDTSCIDDVEYICVSGSQSEDKDFVNPNNYSLIDGFSTIDSNEAHYWQFSKACLNGCNSNGTACLECQNSKAEKGKCVCPDSCINKCNEDGSCKCDTSCTNGCDATGQTCCPETCQNGCDSTGKCLCPENCSNGCDASGKQCCDEKCKSGCELDGSCSCPKECINGCKDDGSCIEAKDCQNGFDQSTGKCKCPDKCANGCDETGATCTCPHECIGGCNNTGSQCTCEASCVEGSSCDTSTGKCACIDKCKAGCDETGTCDEACENVECKGANEQCKKGECIDLCKGITCEKATEYCVMGKCVYYDANKNHLHDKYETAAKQGEACRKYADCDTEPGRGDGFCDSFLDYKCSTKCEKDLQCVDDGEYHYVCRADGRCAPDSFVTVWSISNNNKVLRIPTSQATAYNFTIDWGDGSKSEGCTKTSCTSIDSNSEYDEYGDLLHNYQTQGVYTVKITGQYDDFSWPRYLDISGFYVYGYLNTSDNDNSPSKLNAVKAFGPVGLSSFAFAFSTPHTFSKVDIPDASKMQNISFAFYTSCKTNLCTSHFNLPIEHWDMSYVTDMRGMFMNADTFNQPLNKWDTSSVQWMGSKPDSILYGNYLSEGIFTNASVFNQPLNNWDISNVISISYLFSQAIAFDQPLNDWDTSSVVYMNGTFLAASNFNQPLNKWNTSNVTEMTYMFSNATSFNSDISSWDTAKVVNMNNMFSGATSFNGDINSWNTAQVSDMSNMFYNATAFNSPIEKWNVRNVTNMESMFKEAKSFNQSLKSWNTSAVTHMNLMFNHAEKFNQQIGDWDVGMVRYMPQMFQDAKAFNQDLSKWIFYNTPNVYDIFSNSGISQDNYCKVYITWKEKGYIPDLNTSDLGKAGMICN